MLHYKESLTCDLLADVGHYKQGRLKKIRGLGPIIKVGLKNKNMQNVNTKLQQNKKRFYGELNPISDKRSLGPASGPPRQTVYCRMLQILILTQFFYWQTFF